MAASGRREAGRFRQWHGVPVLLVLRAPEKGRMIPVVDGRDRSLGIIRRNDLVQNLFDQKACEVSRAENQDNANGEGCPLLPEILSPLSRDLDTGEIYQDPVAVGCA